MSLFRPARRWGPALPVQPVTAVRVDGLVFRTDDGAIFPWRGITAFLLQRRWLEGDHEGVIAYCRWARGLGFNVVRVFSQVDWNGSPGPSLFPAVYFNYDADSLAFLRAVAGEGLSVEWVAHTFAYHVDDQSAHVARLIRIADRAGTRNVFIELANEPPVNGIDLDGLYARVKDFHFPGPWASGRYEPTAEPAGTYVTDHSPRDDEWPRKAKNAIEFREGGGPNAPTDPAMKRPIVEDEPIGAGEPGIVYRSQRAFEPKDFYTYAALSVLMGAGSTFHYQDGLNALIPVKNQLACAEAFARGLQTPDPSAQLGAYRRIDDATLRTYVKGSWMVRVRPHTPTAPEPGWTAVDADGIVWRR